VKTQEERKEEAQQALDKRIDEVLHAIDVLRKKRKAIQRLRRQVKALTKEIAEQHPPPPAPAKETHPPPDAAHAAARVAGEGRPAVKPRFRDRYEALAAAQAKTPPAGKARRGSRGKGGK
jgi:hypothetical protein